MSLEVGEEGVDVILDGALLQDPVSQADEGAVVDQGEDAEWAVVPLIAGDGAAEVPPAAGEGVGPQAGQGFFPGGLDPVRDRGPGDEDARVAPPGPARRPRGQTVLGDPADGRLRHPRSVVALGEGQVGQIGVEAPSARGPALLGGGDDEIDRPAGADVAEIMADPPGQAAAWSRPAAPRALAAAVVATPTLEQRGREVVPPGDPFGNITCSS